MTSPSPVTVQPPSPSPPASAVANSGFASSGRMKPRSIRRLPSWLRITNTPPRATSTSAAGEDMSRGANHGDMEDRNLAKLTYGRAAHPSALWRFDLRPNLSTQHHFDTSVEGGWHPAGDGFHRTRLSVRQSIRLYDRVVWGLFSGQHVAFDPVQRNQRFEDSRKANSPSTAFKRNSTMKPRLDVHLSEPTSARLAAAAKLPGATKSAIVEAALDRFLNPVDQIGDSTTVARRLASMSRQLDRLDRDLRIVSETVALMARFHLAVTPPLPAAAQRAACTLGAERFDEFAAQVKRRVHLGTPLMRQTMERVGAARPDLSARALAEARLGTRSTVHEPGHRASAAVEEVSERTAAVREDGSNGDFPEQIGSPPHPAGHRP
jgi:hypothetical protein